MLVASSFCLIQIWSEMIHFKDHLKINNHKFTEFQKMKL